MRTKPTVGISKFLISGLLFVGQLYAHPGHTDNKGGHYNRKNGEYHYHNNGRDTSTYTARTSTTTKKNEAYYQAIAARQLGGETEIIMGDRTRCDIVTKSHAIEVDFKGKWGEAIGQSLNYAFQTDKRAGIVLIVENKNDLKELIRLRSIIRHYELPIDLWMMNRANDVLKLFELI